MNQTKMFLRNSFGFASGKCAVQWTAIILNTFVILAIAASVSRAQTAAENSSNFGFLGQGNAGITFVNNNLPNPPLGSPSAFQPFSIAVGPNACVPTATANGLTFLENYATGTLGIPDPFSTSPNLYSQVNNLASRQQTFNLTNLAAATPYQNLGGTYTTYMFNGLQTYLTANNPAHNVSMSGEVAAGTPASWIQGGYNAGTNVVQNTTPTASYLAGLLNANDAVELTIEWGFYNGNAFIPSGGGHEVSLTSLNLSAGSGFISFVDPWGIAGSSNPGTSGSLTTASISTAGDGYLYLSFPAVIADSDAQTGEYAVGVVGSTGRIDVAMVEAVPEPSSLLLAGAGLFALIGFGANRKRI